jgi:hypothetical protein
MYLPVFWIGNKEGQRATTQIKESRNFCGLKIFIFSPEGLRLLLESESLSWMLK